MNFNTSLTRIRLNIAGGPDGKGTIDGLPELVAPGDTVTVTDSVVPIVLRIDRVEHGRAFVSRVRRDTA